WGDNEAIGEPDTIIAVASVTVTSVSVTLPVGFTAITKLMYWPTVYGPSPVARLVSDKPGFWVSSTTVGSFGVGVSGLSEGTSGTGLPAGSVPVTFAWFTTMPASISACDTWWRAMIVAEPWGANEAIGEPETMSALASVTITSFNVTL